MQNFDDNKEAFMDILSWCDGGDIADSEFVVDAFNDLVETWSDADKMYFFKHCVVRCINDGDGWSVNDIRFMKRLFDVNDKVEI